MIDRLALLSDLQKLLKTLEADLLERSESAEVPDVGGGCARSSIRRGRPSGRPRTLRTGGSDAITQAAAAWVLYCVFARFLEDNRLVDPPRIAGPGDRLSRARDEHEVYFRAHPTQTDRDYLLAVFAALAKPERLRGNLRRAQPDPRPPQLAQRRRRRGLDRLLPADRPELGHAVHDFTRSAAAVSVSRQTSTQVSGLF